MTEPTDVHALAVRLERLETSEAARAALYRYAEGADTRDWALLGSAFADDAVLEMPGTQVHGREAIVTSLRDMLPDPFVTRHLLVNPQVAIDGPGRATVRATVYYLHEGSGYEATGWGDYVDDVVVTDGVGVIVRKVFTPAQHLPGSVAARRRTGSSSSRPPSGRARRRGATRPPSTLPTSTCSPGVHRGCRAHHPQGSAAGARRDRRLLRHRAGRPGGAQALPGQPDGHLDRAGRARTWRATSSTRTPATTRRSSAGARTHDRVRVIDGVGYIAQKRISIDVHADTRSRMGHRMTDQLAGKRVLVTGAAQGMGRAIAVMCARQGAEAVTVVDIQRDGAEETARQVREAGASGAGPEHRPDPSRRDRDHDRVVRVASPAASTPSSTTPA